MISQVILLLLTLTSAFAKQQEDCKHGKNKSEDNFLVLVIILGTIYVLNTHKVGQNVHEEEEEEEGSSDEDESDNDEEEEETDNSASEMEDESNDDDEGDNGHTSEEEGDESEEEAESDAGTTTIRHKRRSSRLGGKSMGHALRE